MSEQSSIPAAGGLLSLNLSVLPQGAPLTASGQGGGVSGFGSMLGQQGQGSEQSGGLILPLAGGALPSEAESLSQNEIMQQQLAHLAQMLEQQQSSPEGELPAQLASELAMALRRYSEEGAVLPDIEEGIAQVPSDVQDGEVEPPINVAPLPPSVVPPQPEQVVTIPEGEASSPIAAVSDDGADLLAPVVPQTDRDVSGRASSLSLDSSNARRPENGLPKGVEVSSQHRAEPAGVHPLELRQQIGAEQSMMRAESQGQLASPSEEAGRAREVLVSSSGIKDPSIQQKAPSSDVLTGVSNVSQIKEGRVDASMVGSSSMLASSSMDADDLLLRRQEFSDDKRLVNNLESTLADRKTALPTRPVSAESVINVADNSSKLLGETSFGKKLESTMDATQQLLQKVAASERISESSSVSRSELTAASSLNGSSTQSILQPAPAQKAVTEGHTLMMPNQMRMSSPAWNNALGDRAVWIAAQSNRVAEIKLDPPELGSLNVRIQINQDQVNLSFTSPHAHVRDAVEQSLPRLREMFAEQGLQLQDSSVSDQSQEERRERFAESGGESGGYSAEGGADTESVDAQEKKSIGLVDAFA